MSDPTLFIYLKYILVYNSKVHSWFLGPKMSWERPQIEEADNVLLLCKMKWRRAENDTDSQNLVETGK